MHRRNLIAVATAVLALAMFTATASAAGPAAPGKTVITFVCPGLGTFIVTEPHAFFHAVGVGQALGEQLHGIPVYGTTVVNDVNGGLIFSEDFVTGNGNAHPAQHPNQLPVFCTGIAFEGLAIDFFGSSLPSFLDPTQRISVIDNIWVILRP